jgi:hypothetical protein
MTLLVRHGYSLIKPHLILLLIWLLQVEEVVAVMPILTMVVVVEVALVDF